MRGVSGEEVLRDGVPGGRRIPDPANAETEEQLYGGPSAIHPEKSFPPLAELPSALSRFRKTA